VITNYVSDYINLLVRIAHIICNHPILVIHTGIHISALARYSTRQNTYISQDSNCAHLKLLCIMEHFLPARS